MAVAGLIVLAWLLVSLGFPLAHVVRETRRYERRVGLPDTRTEQVERRSGTDRRKGPPAGGLQHALDARSLVSVRAAAAELESISLPDELRVLELIAEQEPDTYDRAAARWLGRYLLEHHGAGLREAGVALDALDRLADGATAGALEHLLMPRH